MKQLDSFKKKFDLKLFSYLISKEKEMKKVDIKGGDMGKIIREFLHYGGKRFRPALFSLAYNALSGSNTFDSVRFSFIFELFHTFALIHDDIIDCADLRRGNPTIHSKYGLPIGILAGDFALTLVDELYLEMISQAGPPHEHIQKINALFNSYKQELLVGQYLDSMHNEDRNKIMQLKTADYSFVRPVLFALLLTSQKDATIVWWRSFLTRLGVVFQMKDDYEGVFLNEKITGKSSLSDTQEGKNTLIVELFLKRASPEEKKKFNSFFGRKKISSNDFNWYIKILKEKHINADIALQISKICKELLDSLEKKTIENSSYLVLIKEIIIHISTF